jgi:hypothetical protein
MRTVMRVDMVPYVKWRLWTRQDVEGGGGR